MSVKSRSDEKVHELSSQPITEDLYGEGSVDPVYQAKARVLNHALQEIGMGKYQWRLLVVAGFGWFADNSWPVAVGLILSPTSHEFHFSSPLLSLAYNVGMVVGSILWSLGSDIWGRKWPFNLTLLIGAIFGIAMGGSLTFVTLATLAAITGVGVGGNIPVSCVFLDFIPSSHQYLLTFMCIWWTFGKLFCSLVAWPLIANFSCPPTGPCTRSDNMGWRYFLFTLGAVMMLFSFVRLFAFPMYESPRYLLGRGRDADAVAVVRKIARYNGTETTLTTQDFEEAARGVEAKQSAYNLKWPALGEGSPWWNASHVRQLFATKKMAWSTTLLIWIWCLIGLSATLYNNFLPFILASRGAKFHDATYFTVYRNQVILSVVGIPSAFIATWSVELPYVGRRGTLAVAAGLTAAFLFASTTARSSPALLGWNCAFQLFNNIMYGVLFALSSETFPANHRGTGNGLTETTARIAGVLGPVIALYANLNTAVPVYVAGGLIFGAGGLALLLPFEPRGRASL